MKTIIEKDYIRSLYEDLQKPEFSDEPYSALELLQELLIHLIEEHGLFKES